VFSIYAALIFVVVTSGCAIGPTIRTYSGDKLQKSEVAVVKGQWEFYLLGYGGLDIYSVDGNELRATKVEVLPGWHELVIRLYVFAFLPWGGSPPRYAYVAYNFEAGHEYKIKSKSLIKDDYYIVDASTGAITWEFSW
jgi:hypothetical protein